MRRPEGPLMRLERWPWVWQDRSCTEPVGGSDRSPRPSCREIYRDHILLQPCPEPDEGCAVLEEMSLAYELKPVDTRKGEQHQPDFLALNPNAKVPVIIDQDTGARVFDSNAILLFLAEKTGQFLPETTPQARGDLLSWLMFVATGVGPFSGQAVHFRHFAPEPNDYAVSRYLYEAKRHYGILDESMQTCGGDHAAASVALSSFAGRKPG